MTQDMPSQQRPPRNIRGNKMARIAVIVVLLAVAIYLYLYVV